MRIRSESQRLLIKEPSFWPSHVPAGAPGTATIASAVDLWPTLARITGAAGPRDPDGIDIWRAWTGKPLAGRPDLLFAYGGFGTPGKSPAP